MHEFLIMRTSAGVNFGFCFGANGLFDMNVGTSIQSGLFSGASGTSFVVMVNAPLAVGCHLVSDKSGLHGVLPKG
jgi:hypothetical protein